MSVLQTANVWFESTGNNRIQSSGNGMTIVAGGSNVAVVNTTAFTISNSSYLVVGNSSVNTVVNATTVAVGGVSVNAASLNPYQGIKNRIINGDMKVDQRGNNGASSIIANSNSRTYGLDRWAIQASTAARYFTMQQKSDTPPTGHTHYLRTIVAGSGSPSSTDYNFLSQPIEGYMVGDLDYGKATAKTITISAWVRSSLTGTFGASIQNGASTRSYPFTFNIGSANTWTQISVTVPGDTTGTWYYDNNVGMFLCFDLGNGSNYRGTPGSWSASGYPGATGSINLVGTLSATFDITGVQLEIGSSATLFDRRSFQQEMHLCQRYYWKSNYTTAAGNSSWPGILGNTYTQAYYSISISFPCRMRVTPTVSVANVNSWYKSNVATNYPIPWVISIDGFTFYIMSGGAGNVYAYPIAIDQYVDATAEL